MLTFSDRYLCGTTGHSCSSGDWRQAYANFLVQYVKYYASIGISISHLGFLNEPDYQYVHPDQGFSFPKGKNEH
jgi:hypothetical protein